MAIIPAVVTADARMYWPKSLGGLQGVPGSTTIVSLGTTVQWDHRLKFFRIGEGGWIDPGSGRVPRTPDAALRRLVAPTVQDLDAVVDAGRGSPRYEGNTASANYSRFVFQKNLTPADISFEAPSTLRVRCLLDFLEANEDATGSGRSPEFWELGIFADHPEQAGEYLMVAYGTFPMETKDGGHQLENIMRVIY